MPLIRCVLNECPCAAGIESASLAAIMQICGSQATSCRCYGSDFHLCSPLARADAVIVMSSLALPSSNIMQPLEFRWDRPRDVMDSLQENL